MIKTSLTLLFILYCFVGFTQTNSDSLRSTKADSVDALLKDLPALDSTYSIEKFIHLDIPYYTSYDDYLPRLVFFPSCDDLQNRNGIFYLKQDTLPYCGYCNVLQNGVKKEITYIEQSYTDNIVSDSTSESLWKRESFMTDNGEKIEIISSYYLGKREGRREYYDSNEKLYKIEIYTKGKLVNSFNVR